VRRDGSRRALRVRHRLRPDLVCLAHITNSMATAGDDFEKGAYKGVHDTLAVAHAVAVALADIAPAEPARGDDAQENG
jgi:hypothetical protein